MLLYIVREMLVIILKVLENPWNSGGQFQGLESTWNWFYGSCKSFVFDALIVTKFYSGGVTVVESREGQFIGNDGMRIWLAKMDCWR